jgi:titin
MPELGTLVRTRDGFSVAIVNFNEEFTWSVVVDPSIGTASIDSQGIVTVIGVAANTEASIYVSAEREGYYRGTSTIAGTSLAQGLLPAFGTPVRTADGFAVQITNYSSTYA